MENFRKKPLIAIIGTNASGKSSLGIEMARRFNGEVISADSRQIYKGFDLCCGKVSLYEKTIVPHYMIDVCGIEESFSVSQFQSEAYNIIHKILSNGKLPFLVGGTGLYIDAVVKGYVFNEENIDYSFRKELEQLSVSRLQSMISDTNRELLRCNNSDYNNSRRLIRIIEKERTGQSVQSNNEPKFDVLQIGVTWPQELLNKRIDDRLSKRIEQGMLDEVGTYLQNGGNREILYNLGLEYKYIAWYFDGKYSSIDEFSEDLSRAIKHFAKQQMKWFKRDKTIKWIDMTGDYLGESCAIIEDFLDSIGKARQ